jgi:transcription antitermination factor NusG
MMDRWVIGQAVAARQGGAALWSEGPRGWFALCVVRQREARVESWLAARGVEAFHPVIVKRVRVRGAERVYRPALLPGYVFARFPGWPQAHLVRAQGDVLGAITLQSGDWARIDTASMRGILAMRDRAAAIDSARRAEGARLLALKAVRVGEPAEFVAGPLSGQRCEVVELVGAGAVRVRLRLFGADHEAEAKAADLVRLRKGA